MSKYVLFLFFFHAFFLTLLVPILFFFICRLPFFFLFFLSFLGVELFFFFFFPFFWGPCVNSCLSSFSFLFSGGTAFYFSCFWLFFFFLFLGALCFLSLLPSPGQAVRNRSLCFPIVSLIFMDSVCNHAMNDMLWPLAPNIICNITRSKNTTTDMNT